MNRIIKIELKIDKIVNGDIFVANAGHKGRGVFTSKVLKKGDLIEICPVIELSYKEHQTLVGHILENYTFVWNTSKKNVAIVLGFGSLYNHSAKPNADYIKKIVFTMPYLPSEAIKETIGSHNVYRFSGIPQLWKEHGIPDQLREEWYKERPEIIEHFFKYYNDVNIDFLPSRVLQEFYKAQTAGSNLTTQVIDILPNNNISDLSYINISEFTNLLDLERFF